MADLKLRSTSSQVSVAKISMLGALLGVAAGFAWGWLDYGQPDIRFMYGHVLGLALIFGAVAAAIATAVNWMRRNPMA